MASSLLRALCATLGLVGTAALAGPRGNAVPGDLSKHEQYVYCMAYQQAERDLDDPVAEDCTWRVASYGIMRRLRLAFAGRLDDWVTEYAREQHHAERRYPRFEDRFPDTDVMRPGTWPLYDSWWMESADPPIDLDAAERMLGQVLFEEARDGLPPARGEPIRWTRRFHERHPGPKGSRLLVTLSFGKSSYFLRTGHEEALLAWILAQDDRSITLEAMFRSAYRIAGGEVSMALLTIENVLSREFLEEDRNQLEHAVRLSPIIDTFDDRGDHFGAWYHLWGLVLFTFEHGGFAGRVAASAESHGSHVSNADGVVEPQEDHINRTGARLGAFLRRYVRREAWRTWTDAPGALRPEAYMELDDFRVYRSWAPDNHVPSRH